MQSENYEDQLQSIRSDLIWIVEDLLGESLPAIPRDTPILDFLLSSLMLVEGMRRIYEHFGVLVSIRRVIEGQATLDSLAVYIYQALQEQNQRSEQGEADERLAGESSRFLPLAPLQQQIGFLFKYSSMASAAYNVMVAVELLGALDAPALQSAFDDAVTRYEALRTSFDTSQDQLHIHQPIPIELRVSPFEESALQGELARLAARAFAPGERLFRAEIYRTALGRHVVVLVGHELVLDREALLVVLEDIAEMYSAYTKGEEPNAGYPALQWSDFLAAGESEAIQSLRADDREYWLGRLEKFPSTDEIPTDRRRPAVKNYVGSRVRRRLDKILAEKLRSVSDSEMALLSAYVQFLSRLSGKADLVVGVRSSPLYLESSERVVGPERTRLPVLFRTDSANSFSDTILNTAGRVQESEQHRNFSLAEILQSAQVPRDQSRSPLFTFGFTAYKPAAQPEFAGLELSKVDLPGSNARYDLELIVEEYESGIDLMLDFSTELFEEQTIELWLDGIVVLLQAGLEDPAAASDQLPLMSAATHQKVLESWNRTEKPLPTEKTVLDLFYDHAAENPEAVAVRCGDEQLSYAALADRVMEVAGYLARAGVNPRDRVGVLLDRSPDLLAALLAVWQMGCQYVPLDLNFPSMRQSYMLEDADVAVLLTAKKHAARLPGFDPKKIATIDALAGSLPAPASRCALDDPAYIIYTSGSTGKPKGVQIGHQALLNYLLDVGQRLGFKPGDSFLAATTVSFDISGMELFLPLIYGGVVEIVPDDAIGDGLQLIEILRQRELDFAQLTPSIWKSVLSAGWQGNPGLIICSGGERLSRQLAEELLQMGAGLWNFYGPTETTIYSTMERIASAPDHPLSIGRPIANTRLYILDENDRVLPPGFVGELYIGGLGLANGYWNQPVLTNDSFVRDPYHQKEKMYRTGDLARYLPDGRVLCLGRIDDQVKVHGVRIEPGEIEAALRNIPGVVDAVVTSWRDETGVAQLVGHLIAAGEPRPSPADIRARLRETLPNVMIPPHWIFHDAFPLTDNGKIMRVALPTPEQAVPAENLSIEMPETEVEQTLAQVWAEVLQIEIGVVGRNSDFMDLGGHSLLITPLMIEVRRLFQVSFNMREFFAASTLKRLSALIDERRSKTNGHPNSGYRTLDQRDAGWARRRMEFLTREAELPQSLSPARGLDYEPVDRIRKLFFTGATGFLGAYLVDEILRKTDAELYCLVRPRHGEDGRARIESQMRHYQVWREEEGWLEKWQQRIHIVDGDVTLPRLGMNRAEYDLLSMEVDAVLHGAAHVNFIYPYEALRNTNVLGLHEVIRFAFQGRIKPVHHISTAAIWPMGSQFTFYEKDPIEHGGALNLGYDEAKWVAEKALLNATERGLPSVRYRPGEVGGDSVTGRSVLDHFLVASFKGFLQFGAFPDLDVEVDVAPVDYVSQALTHILFNRKLYGRAYHLTNPERIRYSAAMDMLRTKGYAFDIMPFEDLRDRLISTPEFAANALFAFQAVLQDMDSISLQLPTYDTRETARALKNSGIVCPPADEKLFETYLRFLTRIGYVPGPEDLRIKDQG